jgi:hypothetical protein
MMAARSGCSPKREQGGGNTIKERNKNENHKAMSCYPVIPQPLLVSSSCPTAVFPLLSPHKLFEKLDFRDRFMLKWLRYPDIMVLDKR